ncbi:MAG: polysaccharide pyruvyl transferase family protein [Ruminococcus sp.]|nr:polysaccharide pyruvyl transferase family protein [Ruminococcus sp.]
MSKAFIYNHGGSGNHGCEALVRTVSNLFSENQKISVYSESPEQDEFYNIDSFADIVPAVQPYSKKNFAFLSAYLQLKLRNNYFPIDSLPYKSAIDKLQRDMVEISVGGDIYCYDDYPKFIRLHNMIKSKGCKSVLLGCSLDERLFDDVSFINDMKNYDYISARESITYDLLKKAGLSNIGLTPDSAFTLPVEATALPEGFVEGNTVGINVSPLVERKEKSKGIVEANFFSLIQNILDNTDYSVALIPHVVWESNDDRTILRRFYEKFANTGRVVLIEDHNCMQLKYFISKCRFFIGARTHATIAAYSTLVPTLVLGYSIKSRGIAKDIFGTYENYVVSIDELTENDRLVKAFKWLQNNEKSIKARLECVIPAYVENAKGIKSKVEKAIGSVN